MSKCINFLKTSCTLIILIYYARDSIVRQSFPLIAFKFLYH